MSRSSATALNDDPPGQLGHRPQHGSRGSFDHPHSHRTLHLSRQGSSYMVTDDGRIVDENGETVNNSFIAEEVDAVIVDEMEAIRLQKYGKFKYFTPAAVLALFTTINCATYFDRGALSGSIHYIRSDSTISGEHNGLLDSTAAGALVSVFMVGFFLTAPVFASLSGIFTAKQIMIGGLCVWLLACAATGLALNYGMLLAARAFVGIGEAAFAGYSITVIDNVAPKKRRTMWIGVFYAMIPVGTALGIGGGGIVAAKASIGSIDGWRLPFIAELLPMVICIGLLAMLPKEYNTVKETRRGGDTAFVSERSDDDGSCGDGQEGHRDASRRRYSIDSNEEETEKDHHRDGLHAPLLRDTQHRGPTESARGRAVRSPRRATKSIDAAPPAATAAVPSRRHRSVSPRGDAGRGLSREHSINAQSDRSRSGSRHQSRERHQSSERPRSRDRRSPTTRSPYGRRAQPQKEGHTHRHRSPYGQGSARNASLTQPRRAGPYGGSRTGSRGASRGGSRSGSRPRTPTGEGRTRPRSGTLGESSAGHGSGVSGDGNGRKTSRHATPGMSREQSGMIHGGASGAELSGGEDPFPPNRNSSRRLATDGRSGSDAGEELTDAPRDHRQRRRRRSIIYSDSDGTFRSDDDGASSRDGAGSVRSRDSHGSSAVTEDQDDYVPPLQAFWTLARTPDYLLIVLGFTVFTFVLGALATWGIPLVEQGPLKMAKVDAPIMIGGTVSVAGIIGAVIGGYVVDKIGGSQGYRGVFNCLRYSLVVVVIAIPSGTMALLAEEIWLAVVLLTITVLCIGSLQSPINSAILSVVPHRLRTYAVTSNVFILHLFGNVPSPIVTAAINNAFADGCDDIKEEEPCWLLNETNNCEWIAKTKNADGFCTNLYQMRNAVVIVYALVILSIPCWIAVALRVRARHGTADEEYIPGMTPPSTLISPHSSVAGRLTRDGSQADDDGTDDDESDDSR